MTPPFLTASVEERQGGGGAVAAAHLKPHLLEDMGDRIADGRGRGEGEVDNPEGGPPAFRSPPGRPAGPSG